MDKFKEYTTEFLTEVVKLVYTGCDITIEDKVNKTIVLQQLGEDQRMEELSFVNKLCGLAERYGKQSHQTLNSIRNCIQKHEEKLRLINSTDF